MAKWIRKIEHQPSSSRITIPIDVVRARGWETCAYVIIDEAHPDYLTVRKFIDREDINGENT